MHFPVLVARLLAAALVAYVLYDSFQTDVQSETFTSDAASRKLKGARSSDSKAANKTETSSSSDSKAADKTGKSSSDDSHGEKKKSLKALADADADDDDNAEDTKSAETKDEGHTTTEQPVYDELGWHVNNDDFVTKVMHPNRLQPFYLMPVFFAVKLMVTMLVFGFSLKFKRSTQSNIGALITKVIKLFSGALFVAVACYGYKTDLGRLHKHLDDCDSFAKKVGIFLIVWVTSGNYMACRALWGSLQIENPATLLNLTPKYSACPLVPVPLCPGGAVWLDPMKHIYALVLLPYFLPYIGVNLCQGLVLCVWCCWSKCVVCIQMCFGTCNCCCALTGTIITLGLWAWAKDALGYWFGLLSPVYLFSAIQVWAALIAPVLFSLIYGCLLGTSAENIRQALATILQALAHASASMPAFPGTQMSMLQNDDIKALRAFNDENLKIDFQPYDALPDDEPSPEGQADAPPVELEDTKIIIFGQTLGKMSSICIEQLTIIFFVRAITSTADYSHYMGALKRTLTERTWAAYSHHLHTIAGRSTEEAINSINLLF